MKASSVIKKYIIIYLLTILLIPCYLFAESKGVIFGDRVRVRSGPGTGNSLKGMVNTGDIVKVLAKSNSRDTLNKKYPHGYYWYKIVTENSKQGWIYGRYCYHFNAEKFYSSEKVRSHIERKTYRLDNRYYFRIAVEQSYPPMDSNGLTDSEVNAMIFIVKKGSAAAMPIWLPKQNIDNFIFREEKDMNRWFRLKNNSGVLEKVEAVSVTTLNSKKALLVDIGYNSQESSGAYRIICLPEKNRLVIKKFFITKGPGW